MQNQNTERLLPPLNITAVRVTKFKSAVVISALAALFAGTAFAEGGESLDINRPNYESIQSISVKQGAGLLAGTNVIEVESDGSVYTQPKKQSVTYSVSGEAEVSKNKWRLYNIAYGIGGWISNSGTLSSQNGDLGVFHSEVKSIPAQKHVKLDNLSFQVPLGQSGLGEYAVARCNANRKQLLKDGLAPLTIFNSDRDISIAVALHFAAQVEYKVNTIVESGSALTSPYWRQATLWTQMPVRCLKSPDKPLAGETDPTPIPTGPQNFKMKVGVNQAALLMLPNDYTGHCPVEVNASGTIVTNGKTAVKYRFESDKGELSPVYTVQVDQTHTAYVVAKFKVGKFETGGAASTVTAPSGSPSGGQGHSGATKLQAAPTQAGVYQGFYRLHIVAPNQLVSTPASYKVTCTVTTPENALPKPGVPAIPPALGAPGNMIQKPGVPATPPALGAEPSKPGVAPGGARLIKRKAD